MGSSLRKELGQARARVEATRSRVGLLMDALTTFNAIQQLNSQKLDPDLLEQAVGSLARDWVNRSGTCIFPQMDRFVLRDDLVIEVARSRKNSGGKQVTLAELGAWIVEEAQILGYNVTQRQIN